MKVKFLQTRTVQAEGGETFHKDHIYDLPEPSARRWIDRSVAVLSDEPVTPVTVTAASPASSLVSKAVKAVKGLTGKKGLQA